MLDHISLGVTSVERAVEFCDAELQPLGYVRVWSDLRPGELGQAVGYGLPGGADELALKQVSRAGAVTTPGFHVAFEAPSRQAVAGFYAAALLAGGTDNGAPGLREHYGPSYFAAFVSDSEGHHLESVCKHTAGQART
jgi:catechol 2,3-dioxygenase-like lactoylglutathione lyase family enzyme